MATVGRPRINTNVLRSEKIKKKTAPAQHFAINHSCDMNSVAKNEMNDQGGTPPNHLDLRNLRGCQNSPVVFALIAVSSTGAPSKIKQIAGSSYIISGQHMKKSIGTF